MLAAGFDGRATLNIVIRTLVRRAAEYHLRVGAGIVHDSEPDAEYEETLAKARALVTAVDEALAAGGMAVEEAAEKGLTDDGDEWPAAGDDARGQRDRDDAGWRPGALGRAGPRRRQLRLVRVQPRPVRRRGRRRGRGAAQRRGRSGRDPRPRPRRRRRLPGTGHPAEAGVSIDAFALERPVFGVCLGHQALCASHGSRVSHAPEVVHGKPSTITHDGEGVFAGLPDRLRVGRYHSLCVERENLPDELVETARTEDESEVVMGVRHREKPHIGVQFHPESILTPRGKAMVANFVEVCEDE